MCACSSDDEILLQESAPISFNNVDVELWPFYAAFEVEAAKRNIHYDLNALKITGTIVALHQGNVAGVCSYSSNLPNAVEIDTDFWNRAPDLIKEMVVFHELGHCVIGRNHYEATDENGVCLSVMRSGISGCRDNYTDISRSQYLIELHQKLLVEFPFLKSKYYVVNRLFRHIHTYE